MTFWKWSKTANDNATADTTINWREGQSPGSVNDSARAMMAAAAKYRDDLGGITTAGSAAGYTLSTAQYLTAFTDRFRVAFRPHLTNASPVTLDVDGLGAKPLRVAPGVEVPSGLLAANAIYVAVYVAATQEWLVEGVPLPLHEDRAVKTGTVLDFYGTTPPAGYVLGSGRTIGDASSNATERAASDCQALFLHLWNFPNSMHPVIGGRGSSAAADWAAHKTITLPLFSDRITIGRGTMGGSAVGLVTVAATGIDTSTVGATGGEATHVLSTPEMPAHGHGVNDPGHAHSYDRPIINSNDDYEAGPGGQVVINATSTGSATTGISIQATGNDQPHNNMPPVIVVNKIIKL